MAEQIENVAVFTVDAAPAVRSIGELRENIKLYKKALEDAEIGTKEYDDILKALQINQAALKDAMHATTGEGEKEAVSMETIAKQAKGLGNSYNALVKRMAELDQEFRRTEDVAKRDSIGAQIKKINQELKDMDAQRGKFQRNVGDYFGQGLTEKMRKVIPLLGQMGGGFKNVASGATWATNAFAALSATPVLGTITILVSLLTKAADGMKNSASATDTWNTALAAFKPIGDATQKVMTRLGTSIANAAKWIVDLLDKWGLLTERMRRYMAVETDNQELQETTRKYMMENALIARDISDLRAKAADKEKYTAKQRVDFLKQASDKELLIEQNNLELAQKQYDILARQVALRREQGILTEKDLDDLNDAFINLVNVETQYNEKARSLNAGIATINNEIKTENQKAEKEANEAIERELRAMDLHITDAVEVWEKLQAQELASEKKAESLRLKYLEEGYKRQQEMAELEIPNERELDERRYELTQDSLQKRQDLLKEFYHAALNRGDLETALAYDEEVQELQYQIAYEGYKRKKALREQEVADWFTYAGAVSSVFASLADIFDASGAEDEKAAKHAKAIRTASAVIDTISGAIGAYMQTVKTLPAPWNIPVAAANAASVLAAGYAQIRQINAVPVGGSGSTAGAVVSAPAAPVADIQQVRTVTGASEVDRLNEAVGNIRAYVVESDITAKQDLHRRRTDEASF